MSRGPAKLTAGQAWPLKARVCGPGWGCGSGPQTPQGWERAEQEPLSPHTVVGGNQAAGRWLIRLKEHSLRRAVGN